jgi:adenosylcobinamide kinase/adenosylcobinamide-phosphate guanylyltransferase
MTVVIGGARSGKSSFAQHLAEEDGRGVCYLATAAAGDQEMAERIRIHQLSRPSHWSTLELAGGVEPEEIPSDGVLVLFDCFTVYLSNLMAAAGLDWATEEEDVMPESEVIERMREVESRALGLVDGLRQAAAGLIVVSNEVGMGVVPPFRLGRVFRDLSGRLNQRLAGRADHVYFVLAGLPLLIKPASGKGSHG